MGRLLRGGALNGSLPVQSAGLYWGGACAGGALKGAVSGRGAVPLTGCGMRGRGGGEDSSSVRPRPSPGSCWQERQNRQLQEQWEELSSQVHPSHALFLASPKKSRSRPRPRLRPSLPPKISPAPRSPVNPSVTKFHPQLFYYGGEQLSQQRAEQQLGTQLVALQVLGRGHDLRAERFPAGPPAGSYRQGPWRPRQGGESRAQAGLLHPGSGGVGS